MSDLRVFWGESHYNTHAAGPPMPMDEVLRRAAAHLDFFAAAYYTAFASAFRPDGHLSEMAGKHDLVLEGWKDPARLEREWAEVQRATRAADRPGEFVAFPGYEWQGDGSDGDHNVYAREEGLPIFRVDKLADLYKRLRGREALAIPHHTAYRAGVRGRVWSLLDEELSPFTEVFSVHGCSETDEEWIGLRHNSHMGPGVGGGTWQDALDRGLHLGAVASTDGWGGMPGQHGRGRMACLAEELTRDCLWRAFKARRVYAVTGDRIRLDFRVNDAAMGDVVRVAGRREVRVAVVGSDALDRIELLRNGRVIATHCHQGAWEAPPPGRRSRFKLRVEAGWGPRPNEMVLPDREWRGDILVEGGRFLSFEPCWISPGQGRPAWQGEAAAFAMRSTNALSTFPVQNANVFEFEADPGAALRVRLNGLEETGPLADFARRSREMWFRDECVRMLHERAGISPERDDIYHHVAFKAKLHRAVPEAGYTAQWAFDDDEPLSGETHYRVRVEQRNGQRAWSSPIWVRPV